MKGILQQLPVSNDSRIDVIESHVGSSLDSTHSFLLEDR
jgi:hypothetical protein